MDTGQIKKSPAEAVFQANLADKESECEDAKVDFFVQSDCTEDNNTRCNKELSFCSCFLSFEK